MYVLIQQVMVYRSADASDDKKIIVFKSSTGTSYRFGEVSPELAADHAGWLSHKLQTQIYDSWQTKVGAAPSAIAVQFATNQQVAKQVELLSALHSMVETSKAKAVNSLQQASRKSLDRASRWELTKMIVTDVFAQSSWGTLNTSTTMVTGLGDAGTMASLAAMWHKKQTGNALKTYIFGGGGVQCTLRNGATFLSDVDLTDTHANIVTYLHTLDVIGNIDFPVGKTCVYGTTDAATVTSGARVFCERLVGFSGADMLLPTGQAHAGFKQCVYFTRMAQAQKKLLSSNTVLVAADGVTDGGCTAATTQKTLVTDANKADMCAPCYGDECATAGVKLPKLPLLWDHVKELSSGATRHPCLLNEFEQVQLQSVFFCHASFHAIKT